MNLIAAGSLGAFAGSPSPAMLFESDLDRFPEDSSSTSKQRMVHDRAEVYIRTPCYDQLTPDTIATLQRALKARGYYQLPLSGELDPATMTAIRRYQADHGLDTPVLSLKAAEALGLVAVDHSKL